MVDSRFYERSPMRRLITLMMVVVVCVGLVVSPRVPSAGAAECKGEISNVQWQNNNHIENGKFVGSYGEGADVQFSWKVDPGADEGDEFTLKVPDELTRLGKSDLTLYSPDGTQEVAKGTWNESAKTWTFRLTDYAKTHGDISGTAFFTVQWDRSKVTANTEYSLLFSGCRGSGSLDGKTPEEGVGGVTQATAKTGVYYSNSDTARWNIYIGTADSDVYNPVVIKDIGNSQLLVRCSDVTVFDRTPYPYTAINDTPIDKSKWTCEESNGGIIVRMLPDTYGRYLTRGQSLTVGFEAAITDDSARYIKNKATVENAPDGVKEVEYQVDRGGAGGIGAGFQGNVSILKEVAGETAPEQSQKFDFEYKCGDSTQTVSVAAGETSATLTQRSSSTCSITEKNVVEGVTTTFEVENTGEGKPAYTVPIEKGVLIRFDKNSSTNLKVKVTNTYPNKPEAKKGKFVIKKTVNGLDAGQKDKVFKFNYTCKAPDGDGDTEPQPAEVTVGKPWQSRDYPEGTICAIEEDLESAKVPGYSLTSAQPKGDVTIKAEGTEGSPVEFAATNSYTKDLGSFSVQKKIEASAEAMPLLKDQEFGFKYTCGADNGEFKLKDGETKKVEGIAAGTKCTVEESDAKVPNGFTWSGKIEGPEEATSFEIEKDKTLAFTATNTYKQQHGGFTLSKNVTGDATNLEELQKRPYTFNYTCTTPTGAVIDGTAEVTEGTPKAIDNIPAASTCKVTEVEAPAKDTDWTVDLSVNGTSVGETAEFTVPSEGEPSISILAKNNYRQHKGSFTIEKIVDASEGIVTPKEFTFTWQCGEAEGSEIVRVTNGKGRVGIDRAFPVGTKCSVKELEAEAEDARLITSWENQEFTIDKDKQDVIVSATNTYRYAESKVKIVKKLEGPAKDKAKGKTFTFDYSCVLNNEAIEGSVNITGEGATEIPESFPAGTKCTITERDASISGTTWTHRIAEDGQITIQSPAKVYEVGVTNAYSKPGFPWFIPLIPLVIIPLLPLFPHPTPAPQKPSEQQPSPKAPEKKPQKEKKVLARTGANVWMFIVIAALLVLLGAFLRRRGNNS